MNDVYEQVLNASVSYNGDVYSILALSGNGVLINDYESYCDFLKNDCSDFDLGMKVANALHNIKVVEPDNFCFFDRDRVSLCYKSWIADLMKAFNYKTKRALFKKMHLCNIRKINGSITIEPMLHEKIETWSGDGISESDYVIITDSLSFEEIGAAIRLAFSRCKSRV